MKKEDGGAESEWNYKTKSDPSPATPAQTTHARQMQPPTSLTFSFPFSRHHRSLDRGWPACDCIYRSRTPIVLLIPHYSQTDA